MPDRIFASDKTINTFGHVPGVKRRVSGAHTFALDRYIGAGTLHVARLKHGSSSTHPRRGPELWALRAWRREQGDTTLYIFTSLRGGPITRRTVHHVIVETVNAAGIEFSMHPHMLRHATGFYLANAGQDTRAIQMCLGHKNIQHTVRYTELSSGRFRICGKTDFGPI